MSRDGQDSYRQENGGAPSLFVSTGSTSADMLLRPILTELRRRGRLGTVTGAGGTPLRDEGVRLFMDTTSTASVGLVAGFQCILRQAGNFLAALRQVERHFRRERPALVILVDNSGINVPLMHRAHRHGIPVLYFVPPELWSVWRWEVRPLLQKSTLLLPIFQAEADALKRRGGRAEWVGHPLVDLLRDVPRPAPVIGPAPAIGLFPGSRRQEVRQLLPALRNAAALIRRAHPNARFVLSSANEVVARQIAADLPAWTVPVDVVHGRSYDVLSRCNLLLTCSGTATLEAALLGVPLVAIYRIENLVDQVLAYYKLYQSGGFPFIALPNVIMGRRVVPEYVGADVTPEWLAETGLSLLREGPERQAVLAGMAEVQAALGPPGAVGRVADLIESLVENQGLPRVASPQCVRSNAA